MTTKLLHSILIAIVFLLGTSCTQAETKVAKRRTVKREVATTVASKPDTVCHQTTQQAEVKVKTDSMGIVCNTVTLPKSYLAQTDTAHYPVVYLLHGFGDDHTEWVFHIRDGVQFSDGCPCNAAAVKASIERLFRDSVGGSSKPKTFLAEESVLTVDDAANTLTIVTPEPVVDLTKNLCHPVMIVLDVAHTTDYVAAPIGTGPYAAQKFTEHVGMTVVRNEHYWKGEVPYASIELLYMGDASAKAMALQAGQVDLVENITNIADLDNLRNDPNFTVTIAPGIRTGICHMNVSEGKLLSNATLRHAIVKAIDRDTMCSVTVGGLYTAGFSVLPSNLDYGYSNLTNPDPYDPEEAMRILDEAGIVDTNGDGIRELDGKEIMLKYVTYPNRCLDTFAEAVQQQLTAVGIGVDLIISDGAGQWDSYKSGDFDINSSNWNTAATGDPCEYMNAWWGDCEADYCGYNNPEYN